MPEYVRASCEHPQARAEMVLLRAWMEASLATMPRKRAERMLRAVAATLAAEESLSDVFPIRASDGHAAARRARGEAVAAFRSWLPALIASLPAE